MSVGGSSISPLSAQTTIFNTLVIRRVKGSIGAKPPHYPRAPDTASKRAQEKRVPVFRIAPDNGAGNACNVF